MCTNNPGTMLLQYGLKVPNPSSYMPFSSNVSQMALDLHRAQQLYDYGARLQCGIRGYPNSMGIGPYHPHSMDPYMQHYLYKDPRVRYVHEEPKPNHSYIGLIAMAILSSREKKLVLSDIYQWILDNYPYFRTRGPGWRNSIRHNLSLNDCFIKSGRSANGKGHYWAIHPANIDDFQKGDFRRRRAQRRVRKHMGLSVPDDEDSPSPSPTSTSVTWTDGEDIEVDEKREEDHDKNSEIDYTCDSQTSRPSSCSEIVITVKNKTKKRLFDVESLLAPDETERDSKCAKLKEPFSHLSHDPEEIECYQKEGSKLSEIKKEKTFESLSEKEKVLDLSDGTTRNSDIEVKQQDEDSHDSSYQSQSSSNDASSNIWKHGLRNFAFVTSHPSAFHNAARSCSWTSISPYIPSYPMLGVKGNGQYPMILPRSMVSLDTAQKWTETMSQLVNKSAVETLKKNSVEN